MSLLFKNSELGDISLKNRVAMAPMTRARSSQPGNIPNDMMAEYYAQRASAGLIITEATQISDDSQGYSFTPGVHTNAQVEGWRKVTRAVHNKEGNIFTQLWHVGRVSHPVFQNGEPPLAPSALKPVDTKVWIADEHGQGQMIPCETPRAMTKDDIKRVVADFADAAKKAVKAGFDGVEIHGGNGYLIDQFLRTNSNHRTDEYGSNRENRIRFLLEVVDAVIEAIGTKKVGVRLAPFITFKDMDCPDIVPTILESAKQLQKRDIAYLHLSEADWDDAPTIPLRFRKDLRKVFSNAIIVAGKYDMERANSILNAGYADLVAFGRPFIANPDLVERFQSGLPLAELDQSTLFGGSEKGYTDYEAHSYEPFGKAS
ncbi:N-ethylmaleimide reductase [invertebrate metagenome]|uniref:N-ethylmaleimide reductase n=1 Tax=invertebrate metagenome TaxID=1711999 RepID=A0A2H9T7J7_9ZZZZ